MIQEHTQELCQQFTRASSIAWTHLHDPKFDVHKLIDPRFQEMVIARRAQYGFDYLLLEHLTDPDDPDVHMRVLHECAVAYRAGSSFYELLELASTRTKDNCQIPDIVLTSIFISPLVSLTDMRLALDVAEMYVRDSEHVIAAYRCISFERRLGEKQRAWRALDRCSRMLLESSYDKDLRDHLAERLVVERLLIQAM